MKFIEGGLGLYTAEREGGPSILDVGQGVFAVNPGFLGHLGTLDLAYALAHIRGMKGQDFEAKDVFQIHEEGQLRGAIVLSNHRIRVVPSTESSDPY